MTPACVRALRVMALACVVAGCSPYVSTIGDLDAPAIDKLERQAAEACQQRTGRVPPDTFTTDGCTWFPDGKWQSCCVEHDVTYWCGGSAQDREKSDEQFRACVAENGGPAGLMHFGVRAGAHPYTPAPWRWGYGWPWPRGYTDEKPK